MNLPETLFELLGQQPARARLYRFDSVELKKSLRIDGLFLPRRQALPYLFLEVQFQRIETFYANLFSKVLVLPSNPTLGQTILHLVHASELEARRLAAPLVRKAESEILDLGRRENVVQLIEGLLFRRFPYLKREEIRAMILHDIRKSKAVQEVMEEVRQEARQEFLEEGKKIARQEMAKKLLSAGKSLKEIAEFLDVSMSEARKWTQS